LDGESNDLFVPMEGFDETVEASSKGENKNRKGLLNWFKLRVYKSDTI
jgi:centromeric protein E